MTKWYSVVFLLVIFQDSVYSAVHPLTREKQLPDRIVGGELTNVAYVPYQAALTFRSLQQFCGGVIISKIFVLTAAHCKQPASNIRVIVGTSDLNTPSLVVEVVSFKAHPDFGGILEPNVEMTNDIGVIQIKGEFSFNKLIKQIKLATSEVAIGETVATSGYGLTLDSSENDNLLRSLKLPVNDPLKCTELLEKDDPNLRVHRGEICAGYASTSAAAPCRGDGGGPLVHEGKLIGLASWGGCNLKFSKYIIYANVYTHLEWINSITGPLP